MSVYVRNIIINSGSTFSETFTLTNSDSSAFNLVGCGLSAVMKKHPRASTSVGFAVTSTSPSTGELKISMGSTDTSSIKEGRYQYDVLVTKTNGDKVRVLEGSVMVRAGVTTS